LFFFTHPDKNNGSTKNVQITQIYNNAKERAIKQLPSKKWLRELYHTKRRDLEKDLKGAEEARIRYEARYLRQEKDKEEKAARQREEKEKKERMEAEQEAFLKELNRKFEERERQKKEEKERRKQAALTRKHIKSWIGKDFQDLEELVCEFVEQHVTLKEKSFVSCQDIKKAFIEQHVMQKINEKFFFRTFKLELTKKHDTTKWKPHIYRCDRGYKGISIV
jgi:hypothetical protein